MTTSEAEFHLIDALPLQDGASIKEIHLREIAQQMDLDGLA